ncbi:hypothetical protein AB0A67_38065, partial [Streptomyces eurythermus]
MAPARAGFCHRTTGTGAAGAWASAVGGRSASGGACGAVTGSAQGHKALVAEVIVGELARALGLRFPELV